MTFWGKYPIVGALALQRVEGARLQVCSFAMKLKLLTFVFWCLAVIGTARCVDALAARAWTASMFPLQAFVGVSAAMALALTANVPQFDGTDGKLRALEARCRHFSELGGRLNRARNAREAAQVIAQESGTLLGWDAFALDMFSSEHRNAETVYWVNSSDGLPTEAVPPSGAPNVTASKVIEEGARLVLREVPFTSPPQLLPFEDKTRPCASLIYVPVLNDQKAIGVLSIQSYTPRAYSEEDMRVLQALADHCAGALERLHAAKEVRRLNAELEGRVDERTAQLAAMNKELEAFSYSVSHDLRAPLRSILGFSAVLLDQYALQLDARGQGFLRRACEACQQMDNLIEDLLKLSRMGRSEMRCQPVNLSALAESIAAQLRKTEPDRPADFRIAPNLCAQGDERLLRVALDNLLRNAWKFTRNKPRACIEFGTVADPQFAFFVRDNGAGFDMARADKLFGVFQRMHSASEFPGSGVGLATVRRIINRHGGLTWALATPDQGATFFFTLPQTTPAPNEATQNPDC
jgi:signal transduction histidine kinase